MSVKFGLSVVVWFPSEPWFICRYTCFLLQIFLLCTSVGCLCSWPWGARAVHKWGGGGMVHTGGKFFHRCAREIIMARNLLFQPNARCWIPVWLLVPQGPGKSSSTDRLWVWPHDVNNNMTVNPALYMQNGFIHFFCHESTQIRKYNQVLPPEHAINRKKELIKMFLLIVSVLTVLILIHFLPPSQEHFHCLKFVDLRVIIANFDVIFGVGLSVP